MVAIASQPLPSVTVTVYVPAVKVFAFSFVPALFDQIISNGSVPFSIFKLAVPLAFEQVSGVFVILKFMGTIS